MELCNMLKYNRSLYPSKAVFFYKTEEKDFIPLQAAISYIRGQKAGFTEGFTSTFESKNLQPQDLAHPNLLVLEECYVPPNVEHLYCRFSLRVMAETRKPLTSNDDVRALLKELATTFYECGGYKELAKRYCKNLLLGTWLWRNQNTGNTEIEIKTSSGNYYKIANTRQLDWSSRWPQDAQQVLDELSHEFHIALTDPKVFWSADIIAKIETVFCQEVFPSQLLKDKDKDKPSKQFAKVKCLDGLKAVSFNTVKIGAALQLIDDWWDDDAQHRLRVHEYGADQECIIARRNPESMRSFYSLFIKSERYLNELKRQLADSKVSIPSDVYYVFAVLIKGGMFQKKAESKNTETETKKKAGTTKKADTKEKA
ncbi:type I-F CRISPR-associated protein Csy3 [Shewanella sp. HL-SH2]|uniref:type I-F CRISPR-associated protein Csy3 n=1 Tax=Shewanella sp. HL-SH2 TaxID=3436238 RepID=UPI003EBB27C2